MGRFGFIDDSWNDPYIEPTSRDGDNVRDIRWYLNGPKIDTGKDDFAYLSDKELKEKYVEFCKSEYLKGWVEPMPAIVNKFKSICFGIKAYRFGATVEL